MDVVDLKKTSKKNLNRIFEILSRERKQVTLTGDFLVTLI